MIGVADAEISDKVKLYLYEMSERLRTSLKENNAASFEDVISDYADDREGFNLDRFKDFLKGIGYTYTHNKDEALENELAEKLVRFLM